MSLIVEGFDGEITFKTYGNIPGLEGVFIEGVQVPMESFLRAVEYVLTNAPLSGNDPRRKFIEGIKKSDIGPKRCEKCGPDGDYIRLPCEQGHKCSVCDI